MNHLDCRSWVGIGVDFGVQIINIVIILNDGWFEGQHTGLILFDSFSFVLWTVAYPKEFSAHTVFNQEVLSKEREDWIDKLRDDTWTDQFRGVS